MAEHIVGDWKDFEFKMITPQDYPRILDHVRNVFCRTEPLIHLTGYTEEAAEDLCKSTEYALSKNDGLSFYAECKESKKLAGVRVLCKTKKDDPELPADIRPSSVSERNIYHNLYGPSSNSVNVFEHYGVEFYGELWLTSVTPEFRRQGLVTEIYRRSLDLLRAKGYPAVKGFFSSPFTYRVAEKFGFEELSRKYYRDFKDVDGQLYLVHAGEGEFGATMALKLL